MLFKSIFTWLMVSALSAAHCSAEPLSGRMDSQLAPGFSLPNTEGAIISLDSFQGKNVILEWFNPGCPFVKKHYNSGHMQQLQKEAVAKGFVWLAIDSTEKSHRDFMTPKELASISREWGFKGTHILLDVDGVAGRNFSAKTTPHMFVLDGERRIVYSGAIDDTPDTSTDPATAKNYVREFMDDLTSGKTLAVVETEPYGCSVKYSS